MKKILFSLLAIIMMIMAISQAKADCPDGYAPGSLQTSYNGCDITVYYCYKCLALMNILDINNVVIEVDITCAKNITYNLTFFDYINQLIIADAAPNCSFFPPCPDSTFNTAVVKRTGCYQAIHPANTYILQIVDCDVTASCEYDYSVCHKARGGYTITFLGVTSLGTNDCPGINWDNYPPPPPFDPNDYWYTTCAPTCN